jgi:hypothetical protein
MQRTGKEEEMIMGPVYRMLCGLFVVTLIGAACASAPQVKPSVPADSNLVVIAINPDTGNVVTVQGNTPSPFMAGQPVADASKPVVYVTTAVNPLDMPLVEGKALMGGSKLGTSCRIIIINGTPYCR